MDHKLCKDCKGFCCDDIGLSVSPHELQNSYHSWMESPRLEKIKAIRNTFRNSEGSILYEGIFLTYPMLVFTHQDNIHPDGNIKTKVSNPIYHYRCKHHNRKTKDY